MDDSISRRVAIDAVKELTKWYYETFHETRPTADAVIDKLMILPSAQPKYEPVKAEDFAKKMSENTLYGFMAWHGEALELMEKQGFVICKKTL